MSDAHLPGVSRRSFLKYVAAGGAALGLATIGPGVLTACGSSEPAATDSWKLQVNWTPDVTWAGSFLAAEDGIYQQQGFSNGLDIMYGGPNVAVEPVIESGKATMGVCSTETFAAAVAAGADLVALGAFMQRNPYCIASLPENPILKPEDMVGKRIGIQALNDPIYEALLAVNGLTADQVTKVVVQNDPTPLVNGEVDGFLSFVGNQPIALELAGHPTELLMLADAGIPLFQELYVVTRDKLANDRDVITAGLTAEIIGKQLVARDPERAAELTVTKYAKDQNIQLEMAQKQLQRNTQLWDTDTSRTRGLMYMTDADIQANLQTLGLLGFDGVTADNYSTEILDDIYSGGIDLL